MAAETRRMKRRHVILAIALLHFVLSGILLHRVAAVVLGQYHRGDAVRPMAGFLFSLWRIFSFPLVTFYLRTMPFPLRGPMACAPYAINSLLWALCIVGLAVVFRRSLMARRAAE